MDVESAPKSQTNTYDELSGIPCNHLREPTMVLAQVCDIDYSQVPHKGRSQLLAVVHGAWFDSPRVFPGDCSGFMCIIG